jgi:hypothetical protein
MPRNPSASWSVLGRSKSVLLACACLSAAGCAGSSGTAQTPSDAEPQSEQYDPNAEPLSSEAKQRFGGMPFGAFLGALGPEYEQQQQRDSELNAAASYRPVAAGANSHFGLFYDWCRANGNRVDDHTFGAPRAYLTKRYPDRPYGTSVVACRDAQHQPIAVLVELFEPLKPDSHLIALYDQSAWYEFNRRWQSASSDVTSAGDAAMPTPPSAEAKAPSTERLEEAGSEPRTQLRYQLRAQTPQRFVLAISNTMEFFIQGKPIPASTLRFVVHIETEKTDDDFAFRIAGVEQQDDSQALGVTFRAEVNDRGNVERWNTPDAPLDMEAAIVTSNSAECVSALVLALPTEPVGKGARWVNLMPAHEEGLVGTKIVRGALLAPGRFPKISVAGEIDLVRPGATQLDDLPDGEDQQNSQTGRYAVEAQLNPSSLIAEGSFRETLSNVGVVRKASELLSIESRSTRNCTIKRE